MLGVGGRALIGGAMTGRGGRASTRAWTREPGHCITVDADQENIACGGGVTRRI